MNDDDVRAIVRKRSDALGGQRAFAREAGLTEGFVSLVVSGKRSPGPRLLAFLGLRKTYTEIDACVNPGGDI